MTRRSAGPTRPAATENPSTSLPAWVRAPATDVLLTRAMLPVVHRADRVDIDAGLRAGIEWALGPMPSSAPITGSWAPPDAFSVRVEFLAALEANGTTVPDHLYTDLDAERPPSLPVPRTFAVGVAYMLGWLVGVYDHPPLDVSTVPTGP